MNKSRRETPNKDLVQFFILLRYEIMSKNVVEPERPLDGNIAAHCMLD